MKKLILLLLLCSSVFGLFSSCTSGGGYSSVIYRHHYGYGGWYGHRMHMDRGPIVVVPPGPGDRDAVNLPVYPDPGMPEFESTPLPSGPMMDMDMGMPDMFDMEF